MLIHRAVCLLFGFLAGAVANATVLTINYDATIDTVVNYAARTTSPFESVVRHGSIDIGIDSPLSFVTTIPVTALRPGTFTQTNFVDNARLLSPIPDLISGGTYFARYQTGSNYAYAQRAHDVSDSLGENFSASSIVSWQNGPLIFGQYLQSLKLRTPFGNSVTPGSDPFIVDAALLLNYLGEAQNSGRSFQFSEGFSEYDVSTLGYIDGMRWDGNAEITSLKIDGVSVTSSVPEPSTFVLFLAGLIVIPYAKRLRRESFQG